METATAQRLLVATVLLLLAVAALSSLRPGPRTSVSIVHLGDTNVHNHLYSLLRIRNDGDTTVRLNTYYTVYWTNRLGTATNAFIKTEQGYVMLRPSEATLITASPPTDAKTWETSFTYEVRPKFLKRVRARLAFWFSPSWLPEDSFTGRFGPTITNTEYKVDG